jgi:hypothetical protein
MKSLKLIPLMLLAAFFFCSTLSYAQTDILPETKINMPGNWGKFLNETAPQNFEQSRIPQYLLDQYRQAKLTKNNDEKIRVGNEIQKFNEPSTVPIEGSYEPTTLITGPNAPFSPDWYSSDVQVYSGSVALSGGYRQLDLKRGEDGRLYLAINRRNVSGYNGSMSVYMSTNGGATWSTVVTAQNTTSYFANISMLVERRSDSNDDSTRIMVFYTRSASSNFDNASIEVISVRRTGGGAFASNFASPASGNKYEYVTACSDGMYWSTATYMHVIARECTNAGTQVGLRHWLSTNWCSSFTNILLNTGYSDYYPSAAYCEKGTGNDSIYIAVERRFANDNYGIRAIITCEWLTSNHYVYYITTSSSGIKYERPCITVQQQQASVPRRILITYTRNNLARYCISENGGQTWQVDGNLGTNGLADFTWCNSDSLTAGDGYAIACFVDQNGDSVTVRRGNMTGSLGAYNYKRNSVMSTGYLTPVCAVYKVGTSKYSAFAYAGQGPVNVYFNQEGLVTGVTPISGNIPGSFELKQNFPNPFNPSTTIRFNLPKTGYVSLKVYDVLGNEISTLVNEELTANSYEISLNAAGLASGVYFYKFVSGEFIDVKKMMLIK